MRNVLSFIIGVVLCPSIALAASNPVTIPAVGTIAQMQSLGAASSQYPVIHANGYTTPGDGGGDDFLWIAGSLPCNSSTGGGDSGTTFCAKTGSTYLTTGYWLRQTKSPNVLAFEDFGCTPNSGDSTACYTAMLAYMNARVTNSSGAGWGGASFIAQPGATYFGTWDMSLKNFGDSSVDCNHSTLRPTASPSHSAVLYANDTASYIFTGITFKNCAFIGANSGSTASVTNAVYLYQSGAYFDNDLFGVSLGDVFYTYFGQYNRIYNNSTLFGAPSGFACLHMDGNGAGATSNEVKITQTVFNSCSTGLYIQGNGYATKLDAVRFQANAVGLKLGADTSGACPDVDILNTYWELNTSHGILSSCHNTLNIWGGIDSDSGGNFLQTSYFSNLSVIGLAASGTVATQIDNSNTGGVTFMWVSGTTPTYSLSGTPQCMILDGATSKITC